MNARRDSPSIVALSFSGSGIFLPAFEPSKPSLSRFRKKFVSPSSFTEPPLASLDPEIGCVPLVTLLPALSPDHPIAFGVRRQTERGGHRGRPPPHKRRP